MFFIKQVLLYRLELTLPPTMVLEHIQVLLLMVLELFPVGHLAV
jgi:hypothetical protein